MTTYLIITIYLIGALCAYMRMTAEAQIVTRPVVEKIYTLFVTALLSWISFIVGAALFFYTGAVGNKKFFALNPFKKGERQ